MSENITVTIHLMQEEFAAFEALTLLYYISQLWLSAQGVASVVDVKTAQTEVSRGGL